MISVVIMAHPKRERYVARMRLRAPVVWDERNDVWDTGRRALLAFKPEATHHLVIQDDAIVPRGLVAACESIVAHTPPDAPVSLYMGKSRIRPAYSMTSVVERGEGASFAVFGGPWWGVGIILPTVDIPDVVAFGDRRTHPNYDIRIAQFYKARRIQCWYTLPSIIDHRAGPSLIGRKGLQRHAVNPLKTPLARVDWTRGHVEMSGPGFPVTP